MANMYRKSILSNGIRVLTERVEHVRSVSLGVWVGCGSRWETEATNGRAHFIEHMLFKGTKNRSAFDIASTIESLGGVINAYTGKEVTSFYVKVPHYHLPAAVDVLADMFCHARFDERDIKREKTVILQEINLLEDTPDDYIQDFCDARFWQGHGLGLPVLGRREVVEAFRREDLYDFFRAHYGGENVTITAVGCVEHDPFVELCAANFGQLPAHVPLPSSEGRPFLTHHVALLEKDLEQMQMMVALPAPAAADENRYVAILLNTILGGSMSSRLFQEVRERRGMAYAIHSFWVPYRDAGMLGIYAGTGVEEAQEVLDIVLREIQSLRERGVTERELEGAKALVKGNCLLSMESTDTRMNHLARCELAFGRYITEEEALAAINRVTVGDILGLARSMFPRKR